MMTSRDYTYRSDRSVASSCSSPVSARGNDVFPMSGTKYLPSSLRVALDCDRSLQELDETVASVSKLRCSESPLDNVENSPTSVSHDIIGSRYNSKVTEQVLLNLSQTTNLNVLRDEAGSAISGISNRSKSSKSLAVRRPRTSRKKRKDRLEEKVCITILSAASAYPDSLTGQCNDSTCRSAQFILTDLSHEASKSFDQSRLQGNQACNFNDESVVSFDSSGSRPSQKENKPAKNTRSSSFSKDAKPRSSDYDKNLESDDLFANLDPIPKCRKLGDIINEADTDSQSSPFYTVDTREEQSTIFTLRRDNTMTAASQGAGTLDFSIGDNTFSSNPKNDPPSSNIKMLGKGVSQPSAGHVAARDGQIRPQSSIDRLGNWTMFDESPFKNVDTGEKYGFGAFSPFEEDCGLAQWSFSQQKPDTPEVDPAWDTSLALPASSPDSPSSVFQFFSNDDENVVAADSKSDTLWNMPDSDFQAF